MIPEGFKQINIPEHLWKEAFEWIHNSEYEIEANYYFECYSEGYSDSEDYVTGIWVALKLKK